MALEFKAPQIRQERLKLLIYGGMGTGKSHVACSFPNTAYFDVEDTASKTKYAKLLNDNGSSIIVKPSMDKIIHQIKALMSTKHDFKTVVIDSFTVAYDECLQEAENKVGDSFGKHYSEADKKAKYLVSLLLKLDMNVIVLCQEKREYGKNMQVVGDTYSGYKRLGYIFDLVLQTQVLGKHFTAIVRKSRLDAFVTGEEIQFSYEEMIKRCGLEEESSIEQYEELVKLIDELSIDEETIQKWLHKASCIHLREMRGGAMRKCIEYLKGKKDEV